MNFKLNGTAVNVEVSPTISVAMDGTLSNASVVLAANSVADPYAPYQSFEVEIGQDTFRFLVESDQVSVFSYEPLKYKHTLGLIDPRKILEKTAVRNSVFSQPSDKPKESVFSQARVLSKHDTNSWESHLINVYLSRARTWADFNQKEKPKPCYLRVDVLVANTIGTSGNPTSTYRPNDLADLNAHSTGKAEPIVQNPLYLWVAHGSTVTRYELNEAELGEPLAYNKTIRLKRAETEIESGATRMWIGTHSNDPDGSHYDAAYNPLFTCESLNPENGACPFAIMTRASVVFETYYNTAYDVIDLLLKRQRQTHTIGGTAYSKPDLFALPSSGDLYDLLKGTIAPDLSFTQCSMYECLSEVFRIFDAVFTLEGAERTLGIHYLNETGSSALSKQLSSKSVSLEGSGYANNVVAFFEDARAVETFPGNGMAPVRSNSLGIPAKDGFNIVLPHAIHDVRKVLVKVSDFVVPHGSGYNEMRINLPLELDITRWVVEDGIYGNLPTGLYTQTAPYEVKQCCAVPFSRGSNIIRVSNVVSGNLGLDVYSIANAMKSAMYLTIGYIYAYPWPTPTSWDEFSFRVEYTASIDGRLAIASLEDKSDTFDLIGQNNGGIDLSKMGLNMFGYSLREGVETMTSYVKIGTWAERVKPGDYIDYNGARWVANTVTYTIIDSDGKISTAVTFAKNFNALSQRIQVNRQKRLSEISSELTQKSEDVMMEYYYVSTRGIPETPQRIAYDGVKLGTATALTFKAFSNPENYRADFAAVGNTYIPLSVYGAGNCLCFEMAFTHPVSAGLKTKHGQSGWFGTDSWYTTSVNYTDDAGFLDSATLTVEAMPSGSFTDDLPTIDRTGITTQTLISLTDYAVHKQPNEIMALNYEVAFLPEPSRTMTDFIGVAFTSQHWLLGEKDRRREFYLYYSPTERYSVMDTKGRGQRTPITDVSLTTHNSGVFEISFSHASVGTAASWAICDSEGNIYLASNRSLSGTSKTWHFYPRRTRI